jgi:hypothetical protein
MLLDRSLAAILATALTTTIGLGTAAADVNVPATSGTAKGITGGALLGAEAVLLVEAAFDVQPVWAYIAGGAAGGIAGGVGGYFIEQNVSAKTSMLMLAGGMLLVIPTAVAVASARAYEVPADYVEDRRPSDEPVAEPPAPDSPTPVAPSVQGQPGGTSSQRVRVRRLRSAPTAPAQLYSVVAPPALIGLEPERMMLSMPAIEVSDVYSGEELRQYGIAQETQVKIPVLSYTF